MRVVPDLDAQPWIGRALPGPTVGGGNRAVAGAPGRNRIKVVAYADVKPAKAVGGQAGTGVALAYTEALQQLAGQGLGILVRTTPIGHVPTMPVRRTVTVSIVPEQDALLHAFLATGRYHGVIEVLRSALRMLERDEASSLAAVRDGSTGREPARG